MCTWTHTHVHAHVYTHTFTKQTENELSMSQTLWRDSHRSCGLSKVTDLTTFFWLHWNTHFYSNCPGGSLAPGSMLYVILGSKNKTISLWKNVIKICYTKKQHSLIATKHNHDYWTNQSYRELFFMCSSPQDSNTDHAEVNSISKQRTIVRLWLHRL